MEVPPREGRYFVRMNAAEDDKARLLPWIRPGRIVEIGPGGGVLLDLLADVFPDSDVLGLDISATVIAALAARRAREARRWQVALADARELAARLGPGAVDTVVMCSLLHEVYSYVEHDPGDGVPRRFQLGSVRDVCRAAYAALAPGGRLVIRDGVMPAPARRRIRLVADDAERLFRRFVAEFPARPIRYQALPDGRVELSAADAMEFLYTYTWGEASFAHEVAEQYGVLPYGEYRARLLAWLPGARALDLPPDLASYLQPGYALHLAGRIELTDEHDAPVALPDSNCVIVIERGG